MSTLVCRVKTDTVHVVDAHGTHTFQQTKVDQKVPMLFVFVDIDKYWEAVRRGPPARRRLGRSA